MAEEAARRPITSLRYNDIVMGAQAYGRLTSGGDPDVADANTRAKLMSIWEDLTYRRAQYARNSRSDLVKAHLKAVETEVKYYQAREKAQNELLKIRTDLGEKAMEIRQKEASDMRKALVDLYGSNKSMTDGLISVALNVQANANATTTDVWEAILGGLTEERKIRPGSLYLPDLMDVLFNRVERASLTEGAMPDKGKGSMKARRDIVAKRIFDKLEAERSFDTAARFWETYEQSEANRDRHGTFANMIGEREGSLDELEQMLAHAMSGHATDAELAAARDLTEELAAKTLGDVQKITGGESLMQLQATMQSLEAQDRPMQKFDLVEDALLAELQRQDGGDDRYRNAAARIVANPRFQWWAQQNGYTKIGQAEVDEFGNVVSYTMGLQDLKAIKKAIEQEKRGADPFEAKPATLFGKEDRGGVYVDRRPLKHFAEAKEDVQVRYREPVGKPEVHHAYLDNGFDVVRLDQADKAPVYYSRHPDTGEWIKVDAPDDAASLEWKAMGYSEDGGHPTRYLKATDIQWGRLDQDLEAGTAQLMVRPVEGSEDEMEDFEPIGAERFVTGRRMKPLASDEVGSVRVRDAETGEFHYIPAAGVLEMESTEVHGGFQQFIDILRGRRGDGAGGAGGRGEPDDGIPPEDRVGTEPSRKDKKRAPKGELDDKADERAAKRRERRRRKEGRGAEPLDRPAPPTLSEADAAQLDRAEGAPVGYDVALGDDDMPVVHRAHRVPSPVRGRGALMQSLDKAYGTMVRPEGTTQAEAEKFKPYTIPGATTTTEAGGTEVTPDILVDDPEKAAVGERLSIGEKRGFLDEQRRQQMLSPGRVFQPGDHYDRRGQEGWDLTPEQRAEVMSNDPQAIERAKERAAEDILGDPLHRSASAPRQTVPTASTPPVVQQMRTFR